MPSIFDLYNRFKTVIKGASVIRLHGPDRKGIELKSGGVWNEIIEPRDSELSNLAAMVRELLDNETDVYLNVNNHYEGSAPLTIERIRRRLG